MLDFVQDAAVLAEQDSVEGQLRCFDGGDSSRLVKLALELVHQVFRHRRRIELAEQSEQALRLRAFVF